MEKKIERNVYVWFRFEKDQLPQGVKLLVTRQLNSGNSKKLFPCYYFGYDHLKPDIFENEDSYFIRVKALFSMKKYHISLYTEGFMNLRYRVYFEKDIDGNGTYISCDPEDGPDHLFFEGYELGLINIGSVCSVDKDKYFLKKEPISSIMSPLYDYYVLACCNN